MMLSTFKKAWAKSVAPEAFSCPTAVATLRPFLLARGTLYFTSEAPHPLKSMSPERWLRGRVDAVCITGGEPCIHKDLPDFISRIKQLGLKVKLDSNGTNPDMLSYLLKNNLIDFISMDIKHVLSIEHYNISVGQSLSHQNFNHILKSIKLIEESAIEYEFRTTVAKGLHTIEQIKSLSNRFNPSYTIQNFKPDITLNENHHYQAWTLDELTEMSL